MRKRLTPVLALGLLMAGVAGTAGAQSSNDGDVVYPSDMLENKPDLAEQYQNVIEPVADTHDWIGQGGDETPVTEVSFGGNEYAVLASCKPDDCASQNLVVLMQPGSDQAVGALVVNEGGSDSGPTQSTITWLGDPGQDQRRFLGAYLFR